MTARSQCRPAARCRSSAPHRHRPELEKYGDSADLLLTVRPALTGLWQVSGRITPHEQREAGYLLHPELEPWLDVQILCRTPLVVLKSEGRCSAHGVLNTKCYGISPLCCTKLTMSRSRRVAHLLSAARRQRNTIFCCGNGSSAATAMYPAMDPTKLTARPGRQRLRVMSLNDSCRPKRRSPTVLNYREVFAEQLAGFMSRRYRGRVQHHLAAGSPNVLPGERSLPNQNGAITVGTSPVPPPTRCTLSLVMFRLSPTRAIAAHRRRQHGPDAPAVHADARPAGRFTDAMSKRLDEQASVSAPLSWIAGTPHSPERSCGFS